MRNAKSMRVTKCLALLENALILRPFRGRSRSGEDVEARASKWLAMLASPKSSLKFRVKLELLALDFDLFQEKEALVDKCLELQLRVRRLASQYPALAEIADIVMSDKAPIHKLLIAIVAQASSDGCAVIHIAFSETESARLQEEAGSFDLASDQNVAKFFRNRGHSALFTGRKANGRRQSACRSFSRILCGANFASSRRSPESIHPLKFGPIKASRSRSPSNGSPNISFESTYNSRTSCFEASNTESCDRVHCT